MMRQRNHHLINAVTRLAIPKEIYSPSVSVSLFLSYDKHFTLLKMILTFNAFASSATWPKSKPLVHLGLSSNWSLNNEEKDN